jgi:cytochrome c biogenesis protein CcmG, thiol:disulfide interchange protein DsbE
MQTFRFLILIILLYSSTGYAALEVGQAAPNLEGTLIDGKPFLLNANKGKVVLINFWASWCEPCREEMPAIEVYLQKNKAKGFEVLAITMDKPADMEQAKKSCEIIPFSLRKNKISITQITAESGVYLVHSSLINKVSFVKMV